MLLSRFIRDLILVLMRDTQGSGVFAISSACHRRRRIAGSRWTLRVVCLGNFVNVEAPQVCHLYFGAPEMYAKAIGEGLHSSCDIPLISKSRMLGVLAVAKREENAFDDDEVDFLTQVGPTGRHCGRECTGLRQGAAQPKDFPGCGQCRCSRYRFPPPDCGHLHDGRKCSRFFARQWHLF